jgi:hypothetical protein
MKVCGFKSFENEEYENIRFFIKIKNTFLEDSENGLLRLYGNVIEGFLEEVKKIKGGVILKYKKDEELEAPLCFLFEPSKKYEKINTIFDGKILFNNKPFNYEEISYGLLGIKKLNTLQDNIYIKKRNKLKIYSFFKEEETEKYLYLHYKKMKKYKK